MRADTPAVHVPSASSVSTQPQPPAPVDPAIVAAIVAAVLALHPRAVVTRIEREP